MQLMTKQLEFEFKVAGRQDIPNPLVICKIFNPCGAQTWYMTSYNPEAREFFGWMEGGDVEELGYSSLDEMQEIRGPMGLGLERDLYWTPTRLDTIKAGV